MNKWMSSAAWACLALACAGEAHAATAAAEPANEIESVVVTGTRRVDRTAFESAAPVDVVSNLTLQSIVSDQLMDKLTATTPSFNVQRMPTADGQQFVRPATLRGLSPDQTLVLINGKRRHRSAFLGNRGAQGVDLGSIGVSGLERIEVLRDGASAQYGSDAIAGVINVILSERPGFTGYVQGSQYYAGDGAKFEAGGRYGWSFGPNSFVSAALDYTTADATSRTRQRADAIAFQAANPTLKVPNPVQRWGQPDREMLRGTLNAQAGLGEDVQVYGFATYATSTGVNDFNWRNPATDSSYKTTSIFPGFRLNGLYPTGFSPRFGQDELDYQGNGGVRGTTAGVAWDLSAGFGRDKISYRLENSINASFGPASPTSFRPGKLIQSEKTLNFDASTPFTLSRLAKPANLAVGAELRRETYEIQAGDRFSWDVGPGAAGGLPSGSNGFPGYSPSQAGRWRQDSHALYADVDMPFTETFSADFAVRYEHFSEFGATTNGKVALRWEATPSLALRATASTGFRAPTPGQVNSTRTSQGLDTTTLQLFTSGRLATNNPVAEFFGAQPLKPETSDNLSAGAVWRRGGFSASLDYYRISVDDRFSTSSNFTVTPAIKTQLQALGVPGADALTSISYFVNAFDTRTEGVDVVAAWRGRAGPGALGVTAAFNWNDTKVVRYSTATVSVLARINLEDSLPQTAGNVTVDYAWGRFSAMARVRYFGKWTDAQFQDSKNLIEEFGARAFVDVSVSADITRNLKLTVGAENLFDTYPDEATFQASRGLIYSRNAVYDTDGGLYYARLGVSF